MGVIFWTEKMDTIDLTKFDLLSFSFERDYAAQFAKMDISKENLLKHARTYFHGQISSVLHKVMNDSLKTKCYPTYITITRYGYISKDEELEVINDLMDDKTYTQGIEWIGTNDSDKFDIILYFRIASLVKTDEGDTSTDL